MDVVDASLHAIAFGDPRAAGFVFFAGVVSSIGPCTAPRLVALLALVADAKRPARVTAAFVAGLIATYALFGVAAALVGRLLDLQPYVYAIVSISAIAAGLWQLVRAEGSHACSQIAGGHRAAEPALGAAMLLGASFALVISPCCTPLVVAVVAYASVAGAVHAASLLAAFALGHAVPLALAAASGSRLGRLFAHVANPQAVGIVSGALMLGLGLYYAALA